MVFWLNNARTYFISLRIHSILDWETVQAKRDNLSIACDFLCIVLGHALRRASRFKAVEQEVLWRILFT